VKRSRAHHGGHVEIDHIIYPLARREKAAGTDLGEWP